MKIATFLIDNDARSLSFSSSDLDRLHLALPTAEIEHYETETSFLENGSDADIVLAWQFEASWYDRFPNLKTIYTPAAGRDWIAPAPKDNIDVVHGTFHGPILAESLLGALLFMNHRMPAMIRNHRDCAWDRNIQTGTRLLREQTVLIIGLGNIGSYCATMLTPLVKQVVGVRRSAIDTNTLTINDLPQLLPEADHVVMLLPGVTETDRFMNTKRLSLMKQGSYIYNFGRGNSLIAEDLLPVIAHLGGAFLDVTEEEPLPPTSPLWKHEKIFITPHSSCLYADYTSRYLDEVIQNLTTK